MPSDVRVLEGLETVNFGLSFAKIVVAKSSTIEHPELDLGDADDKDFKIEFVDGRLSVTNAPAVGGPITISNGGMTTTIHGAVGSFSVISGGSVVIGNGGIFVDGAKVQGNSFVSVGGVNEQQVVTLRVPVQLGLEYDLETSQGDVEFDVDHAKSVSLESSQGNITLKVDNALDVRLKTSQGNINATQSNIESLQAKTSQGNIRIVDVNSPRKVDLKTSQGNINITGSNAPAWKLKTSMGNIDVRGTQGQMETKASMGSVRVL